MQYLGAFSAYIQTTSTTPEDSASEAAPLQSQPQSLPVSGFMPLPWHDVHIHIYVKIQFHQEVLQSTTYPCGHHYQSHSLSYQVTIHIHTYIQTRSIKSTSLWSWDIILFSTQGDPGGTEISITSSEEQEENAHELRRNRASAPVEMIRVAVSFITDYHYWTIVYLYILCKKFCSRLCQKFHSSILKKAFNFLEVNLPNIISLLVGKSFSLPWVNSLFLTAVWKKARWTV